MIFPRTYLVGERGPEMNLGPLEPRPDVTPYPTNGISNVKGGAVQWIAYQANIAHWRGIPNNELRQCSYCSTKTSDEERSNCKNCGGPL